MSESAVAVTEGSGKNLHTWDRTISSVLRQDQFVLPAEYPYPTYSVIATNISVATSADHVIQLMAGSTNHLRIRRIFVEQNAAVTSAERVQLGLYRLTTAGSGGSSITPAAYDGGDSAAGATAQSLPSSKGTEGTQLWSRGLILVQTWPAGGQPNGPFFEWTPAPGTKPIIVAASTSNGLALKVNVGRAGASVNVHIEFVETAYL